MKAIIYDGTGDISVIRWGDRPAPELKLEQVRIDVKASGLNRADLIQRRGFYPPPHGESDIPGLELSGVVSETGPSVKNFKKGDRVMALVAGGGYAEQVVVDEGLVMPLPANLTFEEGAAIPEAFLTAHHNLFYHGGASRGGRALIHAGASGIGTAAIQLLKNYSSQIFATVGSVEKADFCRKLGATPINYRTEDFIVTATNVDLILDTIGGSYFQKNLNALAVEGTQVIIGLLGGEKATLDLGLLLSKRAKIKGSTLRNLPLLEKRAVVARFRDQFFSRLEDGTLKPIVDSVFPVDQCGSAQARMEKNENTGKIILKWT